jgi:hypothetical protein
MSHRLCNYIDRKRRVDRNRQSKREEELASYGKDYIWRLLLLIAFRLSFEL